MGWGNRIALGTPNKYGFINDISNIHDYCWKEYNCWRQMQERVFTRRNYSGVTICKRWLYFSNFLNDIKLLPGYSDWIRCSTYEYHLDKDIRVPGSREYSLSTCMFVRKDINARDALERRHNKYKDKQVRRSDGKIYNDVYDPQIGLDLNKERWDHVLTVCKGERVRAYGYSWKWK